jgi:hypothetical protein
MKSHNLGEAFHNEFSSHGHLDNALWSSRDLWGDCFVDDRACFDWSAAAGGAACIAAEGCAGV